MSNDKFKVKKGIKLETNSTASDADGEIRFDGTNIKFFATSEKTLVDSSTVSGTNTGDVTLASVGSAPAAAGASLSGQVLTLQPADATNPGVITTGAQTIAGAKTFSSTIVGSVNGNAATVTTNANLTGPITSTGNATAVGAQTGTGSTFVMQASPTLTTPNIGAATGTSLSVSGQLTSTVATGTAPFVVSSTTEVANLKAATATKPAAGSAHGVVVLDSSGNFASVAPSTAGKVLTSDGTDWVSSAASGGPPAYNYTAQTGTYSAVISDFINVTSGTFTITMPTAVSQAGKSIVIKNSSSTGVITVATTSSQTIDGLASGVIKLGTINDLMEVTSDGANWKITNFKVVVGCSANTSSTAATTAAPFVYTTVVTNPQGNYSDSTGVYTTSIPGMYSIYGMAYVGSTAATAQLYIGGARAVAGSVIATVNNATSVTALRYLAAGDTVEIRPDTNATAGGGGSAGYLNTFMVVRVGN